MAREALIRRFRGVGYNLPDTRNDAHAEAAQNVFEEKLGSLSRRQGSRRAIEYKDDSPIRMVIPILEPGGEYTGMGGDIIIQGAEILGKTRAKSALVASAIPAITRVWSVMFAAGDGWFQIDGRNFDSWPERKIEVVIVVARTGETLTHNVGYGNPGYLGGRVESGAARSGDLITVTVTNPDGQSISVETARMDRDVRF